MVDGIEPPEPAAEIEAALSAAPIEPRLRREWKVLTADDEEMTLALGTWGEDGPARDATYMTLEPDGAGWRAITAATAGSSLPSSRRTPAGQRSPRTPSHPTRPRWPSP